MKISKVKKRENFQGHKTWKFPKCQSTQYKTHKPANIGNKSVNDMTAHRKAPPHKIRLQYWKKQKNDLTIDADPITEASVMYSVNTLYCFTDV